MEKEKDNERSELMRKVGSKAARKLKARQRNENSFWEGIRMFGLIGWSVVIPSLLGIALGAWLDRRYPDTHSWTLTFLVVGLVAGCLNAWYWVQKEHQGMHEENEDDNE